MNAFRIVSAILFITLCSDALAESQDIDKELNDLAERLTPSIKDHAVKKVAVIDFTDLQGNPDGELGKYIAEQLTLNFVMGKRDFAVLDRANLKSILAEHKLTSKGLVDPDNAKKLGMFAGVDALILGTIIPKSSNISLTAKIITTDTAEIIGAARAEFKSDENVKALIAKPVEDKAGGGVGTSDSDTAKVMKTFGDLRVELQSLKIVNGNQFMLTITFANQNPKKAIWVALSTDNGSTPKAVLTDSEGYEFGIPWNSISGVDYGSTQYGEFYKATEIKASDSISATVKFYSIQRKTVSPGHCHLQMEILLGHDFNGTVGKCTVQNLITKVDAE